MLAIATATPNAPHATVATSYCCYTSCARVCVCVVGGGVRVRPCSRVRIASWLARRWALLQLHGRPSQSSLRRLRCSRMISAICLERAPLRKMSRSLPTCWRIGAPNRDRATSTKQRLIVSHAARRARSTPWSYMRARRERLATLWFGVSSRVGIP